MKKPVIFHNHVYRQQNHRIKTSKDPKTLFCTNGSCIFYLWTASFCFYSNECFHSLVTKLKDLLWNCLQWIPIISFMCLFQTIIWWHSKVRDRKFCTSDARLNLPNSYVSAPSHITVFALSRAFLIKSTDSGPMSTPVQPSGMADAATTLFFP